MAAGVSATAAAVAASTVLSLFSVWTRGAMLTLLMIAAVAAGVGWSMAGRPRPPRMPSIRALRQLNGPTQIIVGVAAVALLVQAYVGANVAPNNWDAMTYHLSRAAYWLQYHSFGQFPGASIRQAASAPDGEVLQALTMMVTGTDRWVQSVQLLALVGAALTVFSGARLLHFGRDESIFAGCLFVILPQPLMQSTSAQNDLIEAFFVVATAFFAVRGIRDRSRGDLVVAALALGLAVGTKGTALVACTAFAVLIVAAVIAYRPPVRFVLFSAAVAAMALFALASYNYVLNVEHRGTLFGGVRNQTKLRGPRLSNALTTFGTFADSPGVDIDWLNRLTQSVTGTVAEYIGPPAGAQALDTSVQEDTSAFGLVGFLLLPCVLAVAFLGRRQPRARRVLAAAAVMYLVVLALTVAANGWLGRLMIPAVALAAPLFALLGKRSALAGATLVLAGVSMGPALLANHQKELLPWATNALHHPRREQMSAGRPEMVGVLAALDTQVKENAPIMYVGTEDSWDYPFFGAHRERRIVRILQPSDVTYSKLSREHVAGAVFANVGTPPASLRAVTLGANYFWVSARPR